MNRRTLERACRAHLGLSPGKFIRERKIEHAKKLHDPLYPGASHNWLGAYTNGFLFCTFM